MMFPKIPFIAKILNALDKRLPKSITSLIKKLSDSANLYKSSRKTVIETLLISMLIHATLGVGLFCIGRAIGETSLGFAAYFLSTQIGNAVTLIPATPGGLGLRDVVSAAFFAAFQTAPTSIIGTIPIVNSDCDLGDAGAICLGFLDERPTSPASNHKEIRSPSMMNPGGMSHAFRVRIWHFSFDLAWEFSFLHDFLSWPFLLLY